MERLKMSRGFPERPSSVGWPLLGWPLLGWFVVLSLAVTGVTDRSAHAAAGGGFGKTIEQVQPKMVKIYGAGGLRRLEAYQSGFLISGEGHILTVWSYVLDSDVITTVLADGRKYTAELLGADPRLEIAVLKIGAMDLPHFTLEDAAKPEDGDRVLAFSNLFGVAAGDEPASVQHGWVSVTTNLAARRGVFESPYRGPVYVVDAVTNNPGAAGGALTDLRGRLLGVLGKELRKSDNETWLNYSIPIGELKGAVDDIRAGKSRPRSNDETARKPRNALTPALLGLILTPDVLHRTPPYIDRLRPDSPAAKAGLKPDDLILFVNRRTVQSCKMLMDELSYIDRIDEVRLTVQRDQELVEVLLRAEK